MKRMLVLFSVLLLLVLAAVAPAAVFERDWKTPGDGLLTYDDVNQREWLDLTETQLFKFPGATLEDKFLSVIAQTGPGGHFEGFSLGQRTDAFALAESAGINTTTLDFATNQSASGLLVDLLGVTRLAPPNKTSAGLASNQEIVRPLLVVFGPAGRDMPTAGVVDVPVANSDNGVWLYRVVPEPSTYATIAIVLFPLLLLHFQMQQRVISRWRRDSR